MIALADSVSGEGLFSVSNMDLGITSSCSQKQKQVFLASFLGDFLTTYGPHLLLLPHEGLAFLTGILGDIIIQAMIVVKVD